MEKFITHRGYSAVITANPSPDGGFLLSWKASWLSLTGAVAAYGTDVAFRDESDCMDYVPVLIGSVCRNVDILIAEGTLAALESYDDRK